MPNSTSHNPDHTVQTNEVRQGQRVKGMSTVLTVSTVVAAGMMVLIAAAFIGAA